MSCISIVHNSPANAVSAQLGCHYGRLGSSVEKLSTGLRINRAADDAAGLAIRELMRADMAALRQGSRNASDAISLLQVADGALGVIDEKLIRMKELAEQAATGTYDSTQRLMIASEFQAMGEEIDRIARSTDFNGIRLLAGSGIDPAAPGDEPPAEEEPSRSYEVSTGVRILAAHTPINGMNITQHFLADNIRYDVKEPDKLGVGNHVIVLDNVSSSAADPRFAVNGQATSADIQGAITGVDAVYFANRGYWHLRVTIGLQGNNSMSQCFDIYQDDVTELERVAFHLDITDPDAPADPGPEPEPSPEPDPFDPMSASYRIPDDLVRIHFGPGADRKEDFYDISIHDATLDGLGLRDVSIATQEGAQDALARLNDAIVRKDRIRAEFGALQNRLENTQANLAIQAENLASAESGLSDADIGKEMTDFVRSQVLSDTAVAMLGQANSMPRMVMALLDGKAPQF